MNVADFDQWREQYDGLSYQEQQVFYDKMEADHPAQFSYRLNLPAWERFFTWSCNSLSRPRILELGGWHGEMAAEFLARYPSLDTWVNYEICPAAVAKTVCVDPRYQAVIPADYAWNVTLPDSDVFVACHVIEHITMAEFEKLLDNLPVVVSVAAIEMPLPDEGPVSWSNYHGSHIFEVGWAEASAVLAKWGFIASPSLSHKEFKVFTR